jgi:hypothetical protein
MFKDKVFHPPLLAIYPILFLYALNVYQVSITDTLLPICLVLFISALIWALFAFVLKNNRKAAILVSTLFLLFFSNGRIFDAVWDWKIGPLRIDRPEALLLSGVILYIVITWLILRTRKPLLKLSKFLNVSALILVGFSVVTITLSKLVSLKSIKTIEDNELATANPDAVINSDRIPNIYYIIYDGYARSDVLRELYQFDNSDFINFLRQKGFYVADSSQSNYCQTMLSLASAFNLQYLDEITRPLGKNNSDREPFRKLILHNQLFRILKNYGYKIIGFSSGYSFTELRNADSYLLEKVVPNEFQQEVLNTTLIPYFVDKIMHFNPYSVHRDRLFYIFNKIIKIPENNTPCFIFAHIISPHPPFIFNADGSERVQSRQFSYNDGSHFIKGKSESQKEYMNKYIAQLQFINYKTKVMIDSLLNKQSGRPSVIILQADHGPASHLDWESMEKSNVKERFAIFNAYYLADNGNSLLYPTITPVNTFRVILNTYFNTSYPLLKDESYFSAWNSPYNYKKVEPGLMK